MSSRPGFRVPEQLLLPWSPRNTISVKHAAQLLDVSPATVVRLIQAGEIRAYQVRPGMAGSPWRVNYDSVILHIEKIHNENGLETRF